MNKIAITWYLQYSPVTWAEYYKYHRWCSNSISIATLAWKLLLVTTKIILTINNNVKKHQVHFSDQSNKKSSSKVTGQLCNCNRRRINLANTPCLKRNVPPLACYNFDAREWILILFGRNVTDKVGNQKTLYYATSNNLCFCTNGQNGETWKSHFSLNWIVLHTQCTCALSSWKQELSSVMCLIASNICWDSKICH